MNGKFYITSFLVWMIFIMGSTAIAGPRTAIRKQEEGSTERCIQIRATDPVSPITDQFWLNTTSTQLKRYNGSSTDVLSSSTLWDELAQTGTTYTLALTDAVSTAAQKVPYVTLANASPIDVTIPTNASVPFQVGDTITVVQKGDGQVSFVPAGGVTVESLNSNRRIIGKNGFAYLTKFATNSWFLNGDLSANFLAFSGCDTLVSPDPLDTDYDLCYFNSSGNFVVSSGYSQLQAWLVGGGGGGGGYAGGGGAGGEPKLIGLGTFYGPGSYPVVIGAAGVGGVAPTTVGGNGGNTTFGGNTALGGGGGGQCSVDDGQDGGSGGGAGHCGTAGAALGAIGFPGCTGTGAPNNVGGGGGGAGGGCTNGAASVAGDGAAGVPSPFDPSEMYAGGGGAGADTATAGNGQDGGGNGGVAPADGGAATPNTGSGGGGAGGPGTGGLGATGRVVLKIKRQ